MLKRTPVKLRATIDTAALASIMLVLLVVVLAPTIPASICTLGYRPELVSVRNAKAIPEANREDAVAVYIFRDGTIILNANRVPIDRLPGEIRSAIAAGAPRKLYIQADRRTKQGNVREVLNAAREAGLEDVSFITGYESGPFTPD